MPNRIIKESIHTSERLNQLTDFQFRLWVNLITYVDDYGRGDARPQVIKGTCFPLRERLTNREIEAALTALAGTGCVSLYTVDGRPYLYFPRWESHQSVRNKKSKFPAPKAADSNLQQIESNCNQLHANVPVIQSNPIQSESESESNPNPNYSAEPSAGSAPEAGCGIAITLNTGERYEPTESKVEQWAQLYPAVDVRQQLRNMSGWCDANRAKRKTRGGVERFIAGWLSREQDRGARPKSGGEKPQNQALEYTQRSYTPEQLQGVYMDIMSDENGGGG